MPKTAWSNPDLASAHMQAAVLDLEAMGCQALEYRKSSPKYHRPNSRHNAKGTLGRYLAADINRDQKGSEAERVWFKDVGQHIAFGHGLSVTCGIYGYVVNHSGQMMHLHIDDGEWSNLGGLIGEFKTPTAARPKLPAWPVRFFQRNHKLVVDGIPGRKTYSAMQEVLETKVTGRLSMDDWKKLQKKVDATVDGVPGPKTYGKLGLALELGKF